MTWPFKEQLTSFAGTVGRLLRAVSPCSASEGSSTAPSVDSKSDRQGVLLWAHYIASSRLFYLYDKKKRALLAQGPFWCGSQFDQIGQIGLKPALNPYYCLPQTFPGVTSALPSTRRFPPTRGPFAVPSFESLGCHSHCSAFERSGTRWEATGLYFSSYWQKARETIWSS